METEGEATKMEIVGFVISVLSMFLIFCGFFFFGLDFYKTTYLIVLFFMLVVGLSLLYLDEIKTFLKIKR